MLQEAASTEQMRPDVEAWLKSLGVGRTEATATPFSSWHLTFTWPVGSPHRMWVLSPIAHPHAIMVGTNTAFLAEHKQTFAEMENSEKIDFMLDLHTALNRDGIDYAFAPTPLPMYVAPDMFQVATTRFGDFSLQRLYEMLHRAWKAEFAGLLVVQRRLNPTNPPTGGDITWKAPPSLQ